MVKARFVLIIAAFVLSFSIMSSQTTHNSQNRIVASRCLWVGRIEATKNFFGQLETLAGILRYEFESSSPLGDRYRLTGGNLTWSASGTFSEATVRGGPFNFDVSSDSGDSGYLNIDKNGNYYGDATFAKLNDGAPRVTLIGKDYTITQPPYLYETFTGIQDSTFVQNDIMSGTYALTFLPNYYASYRWDLHKESAAGTNLVVSAADYETWVPKAARNEVEGIGKDIGNVITFQATLLEADGTTACAQADSFAFVLTKVSQEPGVSLNYPRAEVANTDFDLHFKQELNFPTDLMSSDRLALQTRGGREASATVASFDWGAYGTLKVTAYMQGGKTISGYLKGHPEVTDILIPKRTAGSKIADKWKQDHGVEGLADDDDSETDPVGDGHPGDGFTLYEEYRGFQEKGEHIFGDPKKKDLFVFLGDGPEFLPGVQLFKALTGLNVHYELQGFDEFGRGQRLMNFNHSDAPHSVEQHGLWIKWEDGRGFSFTPRLGPPKNVDSVNIHSVANGFRTIMRGSRMEITNELNVTVAHELGHAVHIDHHGEADKTKRWDAQLAFDITGNVDIKFTEAGHAGFIIPKWENGRPFTQTLKGNVYVAVWGGEHCGFEDCIMRYDCAYAYIPGPGVTSDIRYIVRGDERTGLMLCVTKTDNLGGVNYLSRNPRPRYGSAVIGDCAHQICVNDKYH
jgi:hypothetical protein